MYLMYNQSFTAPGVYVYQQVQKGYGEQVKSMPPVMIAFLYETYGGGYRIRRTGDRWEMTTHLQHIRMDIRDPHQMRLRVWGRHQDRNLFGPAIDRVIRCNKE